MTRSTSSSAISGFASARRCSSGTPARAQRSGSAVHSSGRNRRSPTGTGTSPRARVSETRTWQFARLPRPPQYCRATPTECLPCFGRAVSSITSTASGPPTSASASSARTASRARRPGRAADEVVQLLVPPGATRAASGSTLLRSPGRISPRGRPAPSAAAPRGPHAEERRQPALQGRLDRRSVCLHHSTPRLLRPAARWWSTHRPLNCPGSASL